MTKKNIMAWATFGLLSASMLAACSDSKTESPSKPVNLGGRTGKGGSSSAGAPATEAGGAAEQGGASTADGGTATAAGAPGSGGANSAAGAGNVAGAAGAGAAAGTPSNVAGAAGQGTDCQDTTKNCYKCPATTNSQLLNHCTDNRCVPFDNKTLTKIVNGQLPPIP
jgi:hypothetical protein